ncbi:MAG: hypothetical protein QOJ35_2112 [Solirubrobacteraceae bacterium]|jgi:hypothetical protein|nr:hypothetical protein [Solirubrobacteraceae bacterium]
MRRHRSVPAALAALAVTAAGVLVTIGQSQAKPSESQQLFRKTLLDDDATTAGIKQLLRDRGGFVAPGIEFADLTGDGRSDAVVLVDTGGAAGAVALYVFSTHGKAADSPLRAVYRSQQLYRARAQISGASLLLRTPRYVEGDDVCCPAKVVERTYTWSDAARTLKQRASQELPGPGVATPPPPG